MIKVSLAFRRLVGRVVNDLHFSQSLESEMGQGQHRHACAASDLQSTPSPANSRFRWHIQVGEVSLLRVSRQRGWLAGGVEVDNPGRPS